MNVVLIVYYLHACWSYPIIIVTSMFYITELRLRCIYINIVWFFDGP